jgi:hypothetical protein
MGAVYRAGGVVASRSPEDEMAEIVGLQGLSGEQIAEELEKGAKFVYFEYAFSILIMSFKRGSAIHFVRAGENAVAKSLPYTALTMFAGWWGIPWGPIYSIMAIVTNLGGGKDVTADVTRAMRAS